MPFILSVIVLGRRRSLNLNKQVVRIEIISAHLAGKILRRMSEVSWLRISYLLTNCEAIYQWFISTYNSSFIQPSSSACARTDAPSASAPAAIILPCRS